MMPIRCADNVTASAGRKSVSPASGPVVKRKSSMRRRRRTVDVAKKIRDWKRQAERQGTACAQRASRIGDEPDPGQLLTWLRRRRTCRHHRRHPRHERAAGNHSMT
jgi:hypothetical protein